MTKYLKANRVIRQLIKKKKSKFILFPFGEQGLMIKRILNEQYGIREELIIDNTLSNYNSDIKKIDVLKDIDWHNYTVLITSDNESCYSQIRSQLLEYVNIENVCDIFSQSMYFDEEVYFNQGYYGEIIRTDVARVNALACASYEIYHNNICGDVAECGVYRGYFANYISRLFPDRKFYLFDTFSGFDQRDIEGKENEYSDSFRKNNSVFNDNNVELALSTIPFKQNAIIRKGYFPDTAIGLENKKFCFVHLDTDLYKPIKAGLEFFYPRLEAGGYIFVHDYLNNELLGAQAAVLEFCRKNQVAYFNIHSDFAIAIQKPL